ncbi:MAG: hypothetical protein WD467_01730 [Candidatus Saccharimonadales bacterium]
MDNNGQPSPKQQLTEALRGAESVVITTAKNPGRDEIAAAIGLHLLLMKLEKVAEIVIATPVPSQLDFLPVKLVNDKLQGQRDFVIEVDQSRTEADHLKYVTEGGKLKIYITPYNGVYSASDVGFSYGDYHCDVIIGLGATNPSQLDPAVTKEQKLTQNAKFAFITTSSEAGEALSWNDPSASSICEMVMSMSEALGSGMVDKDIATALFTGIVDKTEHFTNSATTPKVMTMAAQLLAAGANQAEVVKRLSAPVTHPKPHSSASKSSTAKASDETKEGKHDQEQPPKPSEVPSNEFQIRHTQPTPASSEGFTLSPEPESVVTQPPEPTPPPAPPKPEPTAVQPPPSAPTPITPPISPPSSPPNPGFPAMGHSIGGQLAPPLQPNPPTPSIDGPAHQGGGTQGPTDQPQHGEKVIQPPPPTPPPNINDIGDTAQTGPTAPNPEAPDLGAELEAARKAVEQAHQGGQAPAANQPPPPPAGV